MFTAGVGDWAKDKPASKVLVVVVSATGLGFFTMVITYLPVLYQLFSRRETHVILLDERAGSPVTSMSLIQNHARRNAIDRLDELLEEWEKWSAELLESHVSYPMLSYYRSQHSDESWLAAMAVIMDTCALRLAGAVGIDEFQAESTLSMCVNALHSIAGILCIKPLATYPDRLTKDRFYALTDKLRDCRLPAGDGQTWSRLSAFATPTSRFSPLWPTTSSFLSRSGSPPRRSKPRSKQRSNTASPGVLRSEQEDRHR